MKRLDLDAIEARCEAARCEVHRLCRGDVTWTMSIPVREDDTDIILTNSFRDIPAPVAEVKRLTAGRSTHAPQLVKPEEAKR